MAPRDIAPGLDYGEQIIDAIEETSVLLLILSESSNHSLFVRREVERAIAKGKIIIPMRIQPVQPSRALEFFISTLQWVDAWEQPVATYVDALARTIRNYLNGQTDQLSLIPPAAASTPRPGGHPAGSPTPA
jgi:hypothetical protein